MSTKSHPFAIFKNPSAWRFGLLCGFFSAVAGLLMALLLYHNSQVTRLNDNIQTTRALAQTATLNTDTADDVLLKVNDLLDLDAVEGLKLLDGTDIPLWVGTTARNFPTANSRAPYDSQLSADGTYLDVAIALNHPAYTWLVIRMDRTYLSPDQNLSWWMLFLFPILWAFLASLVGYLAYDRWYLAPLKHLNQPFTDPEHSFDSQGLPELPQKSETVLQQLRDHINNWRHQSRQNHAQLDLQARFLEETPFPLLRCSINRKVLLSNEAARGYGPLFGDNRQEFVSSALTSLLREAFNTNKAVYGDIRCGAHVITFRAVALHQRGYANLYGEALTDVADSVV